MTLPQIFETALPVVASFLIALIQQDGWPNRANALIALVLLVLTGFVTVWLGNGLTGRPDADVAVVLTATLALQSTPYFQPYFDYIRQNLLIIGTKPVAPVSAVATPVAPPVLPASPKGGKNNPTTPAS